MTDAIPSAGYAGFWRRAGACLFDGLVLAVPAFAIAFVFPNQRLDSGFVALNPAGAAATAALIAVYFAALESSRHRASVGKMAFSLVVVDADGGQLSFGRALVRAWPLYVSTLLGVFDALAGDTVARLSVLGFVAAVVACVSVPFSARRQGLHDRLAGALVLRLPMRVWDSPGAEGAAGHHDSRVLR